MKILNIILIIVHCSAILADNSCIFHHPTEGIINLTSLGFRTGFPRFRDILSSSSDQFSYSFNPCYSFAENDCQNAAVCQIARDGSRSYTLAVQSASEWMLDSNKTPILIYAYSGKTVSITMVCSNFPTDSLDIINESPVNHYNMRLRSRCACWNGCADPRSSSTTPKQPPATTHTIYSSACRYTDSRYGTIDLSSIGSMTGKARFKDLPTQYPNNYVWSYNPCYKFSENTCHNVAGCQIDRIYGVGYTIGLQDYAYWVNMNNTKGIVRQIVYPSPENNRRLSVKLICNPSLVTHTLEVLGEISTGEYMMSLTSPCACWNGCADPAPRPTPFTRHFWIIASITASALFLLFFIFITCLFCSKPKRARRTVIVNEKTPIFKSVNGSHY